MSSKPRCHVAPIASSAELPNPPTAARAAPDTCFPTARDGEVTVTGGELRRCHCRPDEPLCRIRDDTSAGDLCRGARDQEKPHTERIRLEGTGGNREAFTSSQYVVASKGPAELSRRKVLAAASPDQSVHTLPSTSLSVAVVLRHRRVVIVAFRVTIFRADDLHPTSAASAHGRMQDQLAGGGRATRRWAGLFHDQHRGQSSAG